MKRCSHSIFRGLALAGLFGGLWLTGSPIAAQQPVTPPASTGAIAPVPERLTKEVVESRLKHIESQEGLDETVKASATTLYQQALEQIRLANERAAKLDSWKKLRESVPQLVSDLTAQLAAAAPPFDLAIAPDATVTEIEQARTKAREELSAAEQALSELKSERTQRSTRLAQVSTLAADARDRLAAVDAAIAASSATGDAGELTLARQTLNEATKQATELEISLLDAEPLTYDATRELIELQRQAAERAVAGVQEKVQAYDRLWENRKQQEASEQARTAAQAADSTHPALKHLAVENAALAKIRSGPQGLLSQTSDAKAAHQQVKQHLTELNDRREEVEGKLELAGISRYLGPLLSLERDELPSLMELRREVHIRDQEIAETRIALGQYATREARLAEVVDDVQRILAELGTQISAEQRDEVAAAARDLLIERRQILSDLEDDSTALVKALVDLNTTQQALVTATVAYLDFLDTHSMWVATTPPLKPTDFSAACRSLVLLARPDRWVQVGRDFVGGLASRPVASLVVALGLLLLIVTRPRQSRRLKELGELAGRSYLAPFSATMSALGWTVVLTLLWPGLVMCIGWCLSANLAADSFSRLVGSALITTGVGFLAVEFVRELQRKHGLAECHFRWSLSRVWSMRRNISWLAAFGLPIAFLMSLSGSGEDLRSQESLGRLLFVALAVLLSLFMQRVLRDTRPAGSEGPRTGRGLASQIVYWSSVGGPLLLAVLTVMGYGFTARELAYRVYYTIWLGLGLAVYQGLGVRWLRLVRGQFALAQARERQLAEQERAAQADTHTADGEATPDAAASLLDDIEEADLDLQTINQQTRRFLRVSLAVAVLLGLWFIWLDAVPGTVWLNRTLWSTSHEVTRPVPNLDGTETPQTITVSRPVKISHLMLAVALFAVAVMVSRNVPGLIEVSLPQTAPLDAGGRYALSTVVGYTSIAVGTIMAFSLIGIGWSNVQWVLAALSLGIGFGLQELVANFISGLIVLFEQPVRIGDIVTIDNVTGVVTRVKIRATTVRNWDRQEYIIPNKDLITGRVINWTLSDPLNRVVITVGVAYGSDTERARQLLREILDEHPNVLKDPAPAVTFEGFGDSTLNMIVRAVLPNMDNRIETTHQLHTAIHERFNAAGIEIAFPQRDIHIRSGPQASQSDQVAERTDDAPSRDSPNTQA